MTGKSRSYLPIFRFSTAVIFFVVLAGGVALASAAWAKDDVARLAKGLKAALAQINIARS